MYQIKPHDLTASFKLIPEKKKYTLVFNATTSVDFKSKRETYKFISAISQLFTEQLAICEMVYIIGNSYSFHLKPASKSNQDHYNIYNSNTLAIQKIIGEIKYYQKNQIEIYRFIKLFDNLIYYIIENLTILNKKNSNCVLPYFLILKNSARKFFHEIDNASEIFPNRSFTLFNI